MCNSGQLPGTCTLNFVFTGRRDTAFTSALIILVDVPGIEPDGGATPVAVAGYLPRKPMDDGPDGNRTHLHHARDWLSV